MHTHGQPYLTGTKKSEYKLSKSVRVDIKWIQAVCDGTIQVRFKPSLLEKRMIWMMKIRQTKMAKCMWKISWRTRHNGNRGAKV